MLKPNEINDKTFEEVGEGVYSAKEVDLFLKEVSASYEQVFKQNGELVRRLSLLANRLEAFRRQEEESPKKTPTEEFNDSLKAKLEQAKSVAQKMLDEAKDRAVNIVNNANKESDRILIDLNEKIKEQRLALDLLNAQSEDFKKQLIEVYRKHLMDIDAIPAKAGKLVKEAKQADEENHKDSSYKAYTVDEDNSDIFKATDDFIDRIDEPVVIEHPVEVEQEAPVEIYTSEETEEAKEEAVEDVFSGSSVEEVEEKTEVLEESKDEQTSALDSFGISGLASGDESFVLDFSDISFDDDDDEEDDEEKDSEPEEEASEEQTETEIIDNEETTVVLENAVTDEKEEKSEDAEEGFSLDEGVFLDADDSED
jgi:cell division septum initiation protein DivIVA